MKLALLFAALVAIALAIMLYSALHGMAAV